MKLRAQDWIIRCRACGHWKPARDVGIVRIGAPKWARKSTIGYCTRCRRVRICQIRRFDDIMDQARIAARIESDLESPVM